MFQFQGLHQLLDGLGWYLPCLALTKKPGQECILAR